MNFLELFNRVLLELNYRPLPPNMVNSAPDADDFTRVFKTEHLRILENLKQVNAEVFSSEDWAFKGSEKNHSAQNAQGETKNNLENPKDRSLIPALYLDVLIYGATLRVKANPSHPKFSYWSTSYTRALAKMRSECKADSKDVARIIIKGPRKCEP